jgi:hypothetical protein
MKIFSILFVIFFATSASAQQASDQVALNSVMQEIVTGSGPITKAQYDKFWEQLGVTKADQKAQTIELMKRRFLLAQEYQREIWVCAEQAWNLRAVPQCVGLQNKLNLLRQEMGKNESELTLKPMTDYSDNLIKAAATRGSIQSPNGAGQVPVTLEMIQSTKKGLDQMLNRFAQVLKINY